MKDQVIMGPTGDLGVAVSLFKIDSFEAIFPGAYIVFLTDKNPIAYAIDIGDSDNCQLVRADFVESKVEFLGEL